MKTDRPYFIWDYDLNNNDVHRLLQSKNDWERRWMIARILSHARFEDVWRYLTVKDIAAEMPYLKMRLVMKKAWERALKVWGYHV